MIRITRQTDYGIVLLTHMATRPADEVHTAKDAARWTRLPLPMVSKILKSLARSGILESHRGVKGGYSLSRRPDRIMVREVIEALEGPIGITECSHGQGFCEQEGGCPTRVNWRRINGVVRDALDRIPLTEMIAPQPSALVEVGPARVASPGGHTA